MKNNKKGFTLVELLAVIVILAIILLVAVPNILGVIEEARKDSFVSSTKMIIKAAEYDRLSVEGNTAEAVDLTTISYDGTRFESGSLSFDSNGNAEVYLWNEELGKCAVKLYADDEVAIDEAILDEASCTATVAPTVLNIVSTDPTFACYSFNSTTQTLTDYNIDGCSSDVVIPTQIEGVDILIVDVDFNDDFNNYYAATPLTSLDFSNASTVVTVELFDARNAFGSSSLTSLDMSAMTSLTNISNGAFPEFSDIVSITIPAGVTIGDNMISWGNDQFRDSYTIDGAGTYTGTQSGAWTKN